MSPETATRLAECIRQYSTSLSGKAVQTWPLQNGQLTDFHQWADGRPCEGAFLIARPSEKSLWVVIVDWKRTANYYLALFPESRSGPLAEIHECVGQDAEYTLRWQYSPSKQDGRNPERRAYFEEAFQSKDVLISVPASPDEVDSFFGELSSLAVSRKKADDLDPIKPPRRDGFPEGKLKERLHLARERNSELIRQVKLRAIALYGKLECSCCKFDFEKMYGLLGRGFIEGHHTKPLSSLHKDGGETLLEDIALVCSNCHRMLHRRRPWLGVQKLDQLLSKE